MLPACYKMGRGDVCADIRQNTYSNSLPTQSFLYTATSYSTVERDKRGMEDEAINCKIIV
jgi:hypothetical protein